MVVAKYNCFLASAIRKIINVISFWGRDLVDLIMFGKVFSVSCFELQGFWTYYSSF